MNLSTYAPATILQPYVEAYHVVESDVDRLHRILPNAGLTLIFRFKGNVSFLDGSFKDSIPCFSVSGLRRSSKQVVYAEGTGNVIVRLKTGAGKVFFEEPLHELFEESVPLQFLKGYADLSQVEDKLSFASDNLARKDIVEAFLISKLTHRRVDELVIAALEKIRTNPFEIRIHTLADQLFISQDALEKRFRRSVGATPRQLVSILRMKEVLNKAITIDSLSQLALSAGYFDQSHFNRDFKKFTGQTPGEFQKAPVSWR